MDLFPRHYFNMKENLHHHRLLLMWKNMNKHCEARENDHELKLAISKSSITEVIFIY